MSAYRERSCPTDALVEVYCQKTLSLTSQSSGRWRRIASGEVSAARIINSETPRFKVLVAVGKEIRYHLDDLLSRAMHTLVGALLELSVVMSVKLYGAYMSRSIKNLPVVASLLHQVEQLSAEGTVGDRPSGGIWLRVCHHAPVWKGFFWVVVVCRGLDYRCATLFSHLVTLQDFRRPPAKYKSATPPSAAQVAGGTALCYISCLNK